MDTDVDVAAEKVGDVESVAVDPASGNVVFTDKPTKETDPEPSPYTPMPTRRDSTHAYLSWRNMPSARFEGSNRSTRAAASPKPYDWREDFYKASPVLVWLLSAALAFTWLHMWETQNACFVAEAWRKGVVDVSIRIHLDDKHLPELPYRCELMRMGDVATPAGSFYFDDYSLCKTAVETTFPHRPLKTEYTVGERTRVIPLNSAVGRKPWIDASALTEAPKGYYACWFEIPSVAVHFGDKAAVVTTDDGGRVRVNAEYVSVSSGNIQPRCFVSPQPFSLERIELLSTGKVSIKRTIDAWTIAPTGSEYWFYLDRADAQHNFHCGCPQEAHPSFVGLVNGVSSMRLVRVDDETEEIFLDDVVQRYVGCVTDGMHCYVV